MPRPSLLLPELIFINIAPMRGHMFQFSQAPAGMRSDSNEFWVVRIIGVIGFVEIVCVVWIVIRDHRLISFAKEDSENGLLLTMKLY